LILALLAGLGYGAQQLLTTVWDRAVYYDSPYTAGLAPPADEMPPALTPAVVLIVIDGLRLDASFRMDSLARLRAAGVSAVAETEQPSLSLPGGAALGTGAPPLVHGVTTNWYEGPIKTDSIFRAASRSGLSTSFVGWDGWTQLYGEWIARAYSPAGAKGTGAHDRLVFETAAEWFSEGAPPGLTVVYFSETDDAGHSHGGASPQYLAQVGTIDGYVGALLDLMDLSQTTVLVTADHGHVDSGGHGGWEREVVLVPLVAAGKGIQASGAGLEAMPSGGYGPGLAADARQIDVAPTIAALLGVPVPAHALGLHRAEWLDADGTWLAHRLILAAEARNMLSTVLTGLGKGEPQPDLLAQAEARLAAGDPAGAMDAARSFILAEETERAKVTESVAADARAGRLPAVVAVGLFPVLMMLVMAKPPRAWAPWLAAALFWVAFYLLFVRIHGYTYSFSAFNEEAQIKAWVQGRLLEGAVIMTVAALFGGFMTRDAGAGLRVSAGLGAIWTSFLVMYFLGLNVLFFYYREGFTFATRLPDFRAAFRVLVHLLTAAGAGYASVPAALLMLASAGIGAPRRSVGVGRIFRR